PACERRLAAAPDPQVADADRPGVDRVRRDEPGVERGVANGHRPGVREARRRERRSYEPPVAALVPRARRQACAARPHAPSATGTPAAAGSRTLCPPTGTSVPPTNAARAPT